MNDSGFGEEEVAEKFQEIKRRRTGRIFLKP